MLCRPRRVPDASRSWRRRSRPPLRVLLDGHHLIQVVVSIPTAVVIEGDDEEEDRHKEEDNAIVAHCGHQQVEHGADNDLRHLEDGAASCFPVTAITANLKQQHIAYTHAYTNKVNIS